MNGRTGDIDEPTVISAKNSWHPFSLSSRAAADDEALAPIEKQKLTDQYGTRAVELLIRARDEGAFAHGRRQFGLGLRGLLDFSWLKCLVRVKSVMTLAKSGNVPAVAGAFT